MAPVFMQVDKEIISRRNPRQHIPILLGAASEVNAEQHLSVKSVCTEATWSVCGHQGKGTQHRG